MQTNKMRTLPLLVLLTTLLSRMQSCACVEVPVRFKYINKRSIESVQTTDRPQSEQDAIPLEFYRKLDNVSDVYEFIDRFVDKENLDPQVHVLEPEKRSVQRFNAVKAEPANCMPESTTVELKPLVPDKDPTMFYFPKCTRVKRCGGCCNSDLLSCQPTGTEIINFEVKKYRFGGKVSAIVNEIIPVEQHTKCICDCRLKAKDCNSYQNYSPHLCRCICVNEDAMQKCLAEENKYWDDTTCRCVCRGNQSCTTGTFFDENQCKCIDRTGGELSLADRRRFIVKAVPVEVEPDNSTLYSL